MTVRNQRHQSNDEKVKEFLASGAAGGVRVRLAITEPLGASQIAEWPREAIEADEEGTRIKLLQAAQDHADEKGADAKYLAQWMSDRNRSVKQLTIPIAAVSQVDAGEARQASTVAISDASIIRDLLNTIDRQNRQMQQSYGVVLASYERALAMQQAQIETLSNRAVDAGPVVLTDEQREESLQRSAALAAFTGKLPEVLDLGIAAVARHMLKADAAAGLNGGAPVEHEATEEG